MLRWKFQVFFILLFLLLGSVPWLPRASAQVQPAAPETRTGTTANHTLYLPLVLGAGTPAGNAPTISAFTADPATIAPGAATTLSWNVSGATRLRIEPDIGEVTAPVEVRPAATTTYTLIAGNATGEARATTSVTVSALPPGDQGALLFGNSSFRSADIAVDAQGGIHTVFSKIPPIGDGEIKFTYYAYCATPAQCGTLAGWQITEIPNAVDFPWAQLELTPQGRPRLLLMRTVYPDNGSFTGGKQYVYAECNSTCTQAQNWSLMEVLVSPSGGGLYDSDYSYHTFALDNQGRPRFIYEDRANSSGDHAGAYYVYCDANCTTPGTWFETRLDPHNDNVYITEYALLRFTPDGRPRVFGTDGNISTRLSYLECNSDCDNSANWSMPAHLFDIKTGPGHRNWSAAFDQQGNPRLAFYPGAGPLFYAWCNGTCRDSTNWDGVQVPLSDAASGEHPSLALDAQGHPRIAYRDRDQYGLGYAFCNENCESAQGRWTTGLVEDDNQLNQEFPIKPLPHCDTSAWFGGLRNNLTLDAQGNPRIAYDAELMMRCKRYPDDPNSNETFVETKWWTVRVVYFPQP